MVSSHLIQLLNKHTISWEIWRRQCETWKRLADKFHEIQPQLRAELIMAQDTNMHNVLERIRSCRPWQWTIANHRRVWNDETQRKRRCSTDKITFGDSRQQMDVYLQTRTHRRIVKIERSRNGRRHECHLGHWVHAWRAPKRKKPSGPRSNGNWIGAARVLALLHSALSSTRTLAISNSARNLSPGDQFTKPAAQSV